MLLTFIYHASTNVRTCLDQRNQYISGNWSCALPRQDSLHLWRDAVTGDLPWPGMTIGVTTIAMFVWCNDQVSIQMQWGKCIYVLNPSLKKLSLVLYQGVLTM